MLIIHVAQMAVLSSIVRLQYVKHSCPSDSNESMGTSGVYSNESMGTSHVEPQSKCLVVQPLLWCLIIWPFFNVCLDLLSSIHHSKRKADTESKRKADPENRSPSLDVGTLMQSICSWFFPLTFLVSTLVWVITVSTSSLNHLQDESLGVVLLIGGLYTVNFISIFEPFKILLDTLKTIVLNVVLRIGVIYVVILTSFSLSLSTVNRKRSISQTSTDSVWFTFYALCLQTFGAEDPVNQDLSSQPDIADSDVWLYRVIILIYVFISSIVLLNLLIAMMTDSYKKANKSAKNSVAAEKLRTLSLVIYVVKIFSARRGC